MGILFAFSSLPALKYGEKPGVSFKEFYGILDLNLGTKDKERLVSFRRMIDVKNILSFQTGVKFDGKGNFLEAGLRLALTNSEYLPEYILDFVEDRSDEESLVRDFPQLYAVFFEREISKGGILAEFLSFERDLNLLLMAYNAKRTGIDIESFLQYEDPDSPLVALVAMQAKSSGSFIFPYEYAILEDRLQQAGSDPMKQYEAVSSFRYNFYNSFVEESSGSFRALCAYMMNLWMLEERASLDDKIGREILTELVESGYE